MAEKTMITFTAMPQEISFSLSAIQGRMMLGAETDAVRVTGRLESTRTGKNAHWRSSLPRDFFSSPFEPWIDLLFQGNLFLEALGWHESARTLEDPVNPYLSAGGTADDTPFYVSAQQVYDLSRRAERRALLPLLHAPEDDGTTLRQGGLRVSFVHVDETILEALRPFWTAPNRPVAIFNHALMAKGKRLIRADNWRLVYAPEGAEILITSPDHPFEAIRFNSNRRQVSPWGGEDRGTYLFLEHPWPAQGGRD